MPDEKVDPETTIFIDTKSEDSELKFINNCTLFACGGGVFHLGINRFEETFKPVQFEDENSLSKIKAIRVPQAFGYFCVLLAQYVQLSNSP
jgi:hypothetical protein